MEIKTNQNFISVDGKTARNSYGDFFTVGETVAHQETSFGEAKIMSFEPKTEENEITVMTDRGYTHLDFLIKA